MPARNLDIQIPPRLDALLGESPLAEAVRLSVRAFEPWIGDGTQGLFFFPEYTDHGPRHVSAVLASLEALVHIEAWPLLTPEDAAVLVLAALLHDSAMHLTADGLLDLLDSERAEQRPLLAPLDAKSWPELFDDFFTAARRWDQRTLHRILGDRERRPEQEEDLYAYIRSPGEMPDPETWSVRYRKFLGEFVRRHHARLAHEIALHGVPGPRAVRLCLTEIPPDYADLAGLVARSHNLDLRETFPYLKKKYSQRAICRGSHPVFLMVLLRIADYLEIRSDRANATRLKVQRLRSPISREEWDAHLAVHDITPDERDAESVFVHASPESATEFLKLRRLLAGLQAELDTSWAVLGEVYSRQGDIAKLGLTLRRVRSNLDDPGTFLADQEPAYFPLYAAFDTAGADLLKLLIRPLYGDRPEVGVRELLQNALDAVHELRQHARDQGDPEMSDISLPNQEADVLISVDLDEAGQDWLTVSDKGIGMTAETVRDYFLKAGASFRQSDAWRRSFEVDGKSKVLRSGRFGIGALAAFLLGDRIEVSTRYVEAKPEDGIRFEASIDDSAIELRREIRQAIGTTVRVRMSERALKALSIHTYRDPWDWYVFDDPRVERRLYGTVCVQKYHLPAGTGPGDLPADWRCIVPEGYQAVHWTYSEAEAPLLACNGIIVDFDNPFQLLFEAPSWDAHIDLKMPAISVIDRDGQLPLSLKRDSLVGGKLPFSAALLHDVVSDLCACYLVHAPRRMVANSGLSSILKGHDSLTHAGLFFTSKGTAPTFPWNLRCCGLQRVFLLSFSPGRPGFSLANLPALPVNAALLVAESCTPQTVSSYFSRLFRHWAFRFWEPDESDAGWVLTEFGKIPDAEDDWPCAARQRVYFGVKIAEILPGPATAATGDSSALDQILAEILDQPIIPYDPEERRRKFPRAFELLRDYIAVWRSTDLTGWRRKLVEALADPLKTSPD
jgi:histidine kinase/DNA gyrase B/HSP90-like ATPase